MTAKQIVNHFFPCSTLTRALFSIVGGFPWLTAIGVEVVVAEKSHRVENGFVWLAAGRNSFDTAERVARNGGFFDTVLDYVYERNG